MELALSSFELPLVEVFRAGVVLVGARQVGKTTLARLIGGRRKGPSTAFDLEDPTDLARLADPMLALRALRGLVIIDEVQRRPDLFPVLRVLADRPRTPARFLILVECLVRVPMKHSSRGSPSFTGTPPSFMVRKATMGSRITSCLLPNPPPIYGLTTRTRPHGISRASPTMRRQMCGIWVEDTTTMCSMSSM